MLDSIIVNLDWAKHTDCHPCIRPPRLCRLKDYRLQFSKGGPGYANIHRSSGNTVYGLAYLMDDRAFALLDGYEGCHTTQLVPSGTDPTWWGHYYRMGCTLEIQSEDGAWAEEPAIAYKAVPRAIEAGRIPSDEYLAHLLAGEELLPSEYVDSIRHAATVPSTADEDPPTNDPPTVDLIAH